MTTRRKSSSFALPFTATRSILKQLLSLFYADKLTSGALQYAVRPIVQGSYYLGLLKGGKVGVKSMQNRSARIATTLYESILDCLNFTFWVGLFLIIADVMFGNRLIFNFLDSNRWLACIFFFIIGFRMTLRS